MMIGLRWEHVWEGEQGVYTRLQDLVKSRIQYNDARETAGRGRLKFIWCLFNEYNFKEYWRLPEQLRNEDRSVNMALLAQVTNGAAQAIHEIDRESPVTTALGASTARDEDTKNLSIIFKNTDQIDFYSFNAYYYLYPEDLILYYLMFAQEADNRPIWISEIGADSYDNRGGLEDGDTFRKQHMLDDFSRMEQLDQDALGRFIDRVKHTNTQARFYLEVLPKLMNYPEFLMGFTMFELRNETGTDKDNTVSVGAFYDQYSNEEHYGLYYDTGEIKPAGHMIRHLLSRKGGQFVNIKEGDREQRVFSTFYIQGTDIPYMRESYITDEILVYDADLGRKRITWIPKDIYYLVHDNMPAEDWQTWIENARHGRLQKYRFTAVDFGYLHKDSRFLQTRELAKIFNHNNTGEPEQELSTMLVEESYVVSQGVVTVYFYSKEGLRQLTGPAESVAGLSEQVITAMNQEARNTAQEIKEQGATSVPQLDALFRKTPTAPSNAPVPASTDSIPMVPTTSGHHISAELMSRTAADYRTKGEIEVAARFELVAGALQWLEQYLHESGKMTGPPYVVATRQDKEIIYNLSPAQIRSILRSSLNPITRQDYSEKDINFIISQISLHESGDTDTAGIQVQYDAIKELLTQEQTVSVNPTHLKFVLADIYDPEGKKIGSRIVGEAEYTYRYDYRLLEDKERDEMRRIRDKVSTNPNLKFPDIVSYMSDTDIAGKALQIYQLVPVGDGVEELDAMKQFRGVLDKNGRALFLIFDAWQRIRFLFYSRSGEDVATIDYDYYQDADGNPVIGDMRSIGIVLDVEKIKGSIKARDEQGNEIAIEPDNQPEVQFQYVLVYNRGIKDKETEQWFIEKRNRTEFGVLEEVQYGEWLGDESKPTVNTVASLQELSGERKFQRLQELRNNFRVTDIESLVYTPVTWEEKDGTWRSVEIEPFVNPFNGKTYRREYLRLSQIPRLVMGAVVEEIDTPDGKKLLPVGRPYSVSSLYGLAFEQRAGQNAMKIVLIRENRDSANEDEFKEGIIALRFHTLEIKDILGRTEEVWYGRKNQDGSYTVGRGDSKLRKFYQDTGEGIYYTARKGVATVLLDDEQEMAWNVAETVGVEEGAVSVRLQEGIQFVTQGREIILTGRDDYSLDYVSGEKEIIFDNRGRMLRGVSDFDNEGNPHYISFVDSANTSYLGRARRLLGINPALRTYYYRDSEDYSTYRPQDLFYTDTFAGGLMLSGDARFVYGKQYAQIPQEPEFDLVLKYQVLSPSGLMYCVLYDILRPGDDEERVKLYFKANLPLYSVKIEEATLEELTKDTPLQEETPYKMFSIETSGPGTGKVRFHEYDHQWGGDWVYADRYREYKGNHWVFFRYNMFTTRTVREDGQRQWYYPQDSWALTFIKDNVRNNTLNALTGRSLPSDEELPVQERYLKDEVDHAIPAFVAAPFSFWKVGVAVLPAVLFIIVTLHLLGPINIFRWWSSLMLWQRRIRLGRQTQRDSQQYLGQLLTLMADAVTVQDLNGIMLSQNLSRSFRTGLQDLFNFELLTIEQFHEVVARAQEEIVGNTLVSLSALCGYLLNQSRSVSSQGLTPERLDAQKQEVLTLLDQLFSAHTESEILNVVERFPQDFVSVLADLFNQGILSVDAVREIVQRAITAVSAQQSLQVHNPADFSKVCGVYLLTPALAAHYLMTECLYAALVPVLDGYFDAYHFHTVPLILDRLIQVRNGLVTIMGGGRANLGVVMFRTNAPGPFAYLDNLLKVAQLSPTVPNNNSIVGNQQVVVNILEEMIAFVQTHGRVLSSSEYDEIISHHVPRTHVAWYDLTNALSELIGGQIHRHNRTVTKREMIIDDVLRRYIELRSRSVSRRLGTAQDGIYVKYKKRMAGYVEVPLEEYTVMRMIQQEINVNRPTFVARMVELAMGMRPGLAPRIFPTIMAYDRFWSYIFMDTVHGIFVGGIKAKQPLDPRLVMMGQDQLDDPKTGLRKQLADKEQEIRQAKSRKPRDGARMAELNKERAEKEEQIRNLERTMAGVQSEIEDTVHGSNHVKWRPQFFPDDFDRLHKRLSPLRRSLGLTLDQARECLERVITRQQIDLLERARRYGKEADYLALQPMISDALNSARAALTVVPAPATAEDFYNRLSDALLQLTLIDVQLINVKKIFPFGPVMDTRDRMFTYRARFVQEIVDVVLLPQKRLEAQKFKIPLVSYAMKMRRVYFRYFMPLFDRRFWNIPENISLPALIWGVVTNRDFWNEIGEELGLSDQEVQHMRGGLNEFMRILRNFIYYNSLMHFLITYICLPKLLASLGLLSFPGNLPVIILAIFIATWFGNAFLFGSSAFYLRIFRVAKEHVEDINAYTVRTIGDIHIGLSLLQGRSIGTRMGRCLFYSTFILLAAGFFGVGVGIGALLTYAGWLSWNGAFFLGGLSALPIIWWMIFRLTQGPRLRGSFSLVYTGDNREKALAMWKQVVEDWASPDLNLISFVQRERLLSLDGISHYELWRLHPEVLHRIKRFLNKFYRSDIPACAEGQTTPYQTWDEIPRTLFHATVAGEWDHDWNWTVQHLPDLLNNPATMIEWENYLRDVAKLKEKQIQALTRALRIFPYLSYQARTGFGDLKSSIDRVLIAAIDPELLEKIAQQPSDPLEREQLDEDKKKLLKKIEQALTFFATMRDDVIVRLEDRNRRYLTVMEDTARDYFADPVYLVLRMRAESGQPLSDAQRDYLEQAESNYCLLATEKAAFNAQYVGKWMGDVAPATPAQHKALAERFADLSNFTIVEPMNYSGLMPIKDSAWMVQVPVMIGARHFVAQDVSNRVSIEEFQTLPHLAYLYELNPRLGQQLMPLYADEQHLTLSGGCGGHAETVWAHPVQDGINQIGTLTMYGKTSAEADMYFGEFLPSLAQDTERLMSPWRARGRDISSGRSGTGPLNRAAEDALQGEGFLA
ncbi:MAG: DUF3450 domain-containing protein, partial [Candidatus Omnitrophica bacterium]|nr:DUF3450 domain-containing protein [Candidatus Omnitrophota bacterium]